MERKNTATKKHSFEVTRAHEFNDGSVTFDLKVDGFVTIYGCRVVESKKGDFIGFPSRKGKDDKYYSHAYCDLTAEDTNAILDLVSEKLN